jgi:signal transduction histidine kinase
MNELLESILEELNYELTRKNVKIELDDQLPVFISNQAIMKHIFLNLIDNACKYLPLKKQGNRIKITHNYDKGYSIFQVSDNGVGIPEEKQIHVFDSYQRASTSPDESGGKGLGLALVKNMVGKINGEISFSSKEGQGTTFFIRFKNINNN